MLSPHAAGVFRLPALILFFATIGAAETFVVNTLGDPAIKKDDELSLREAILAANDSPGDDLIGFDVSGTIQPESELPDITDQTGPVEIRGDRNIILDGSLLSGIENGLTITSAQNFITGLAIVRFPGDGIQIVGKDATNNTVEGCLIGTNDTGSGGFGNGDTGITIAQGAASNIIGGPNRDEENVISGNGGAGVRIVGDLTQGNIVRGNYIGVHPDVQDAVPNSGNGVEIDDAPDNVIGGTTVNAGNIIAGNGVHGISISGGSATGNQVSANIIGLIQALKAEPNIIDGVSVSGGATDNTIGGAAPAQRNIISGNGRHGVRLAGPGVENNVLLGNYIGCSVDGADPRPNLQRGVQIEEGASNNVVGGTGDGEGNVISGNGSHGVLIVGATTRLNVIQGNLIGTSASGGAAVGNGGDGVALIDRTTQNKIGEQVAGGGNVISGNDGDGVSIDGTDVNSNTVRNNIIGLNATGTAPIGNGGDGVRIASGAAFNGVGGSGGETGNIISGNALCGVRVTGVDTDSTTILGNIIGLRSSGTSAAANGEHGVLISAGASNTRVGRFFAGAGNVISGNGQDGVRVVDIGTTNVTLENNFIGTDSTGQTGVGNGDNGVSINSSADHVIGGDAPVARNVISGNVDSGIRLSGAIGTIVRNNLIGVGVDGETPVGNGLDGILIDASARMTEVGGDMSGVANIIANNGGDGVEVSGGSDRNEIRRNSIYANSRGIALTGGGNNGIARPTVNGLDPLRGLSFVGAEVDVYADAGNQGEIYLTTTTPSGDGTYSISSGVLDLSPYQGMNITVVSVDPNGNTSEFSAISDNSFVEDTDPPVITLNGDAAITLECGDSFTDPGVTALDNVDGDITGDVEVSGSVDVDSPGNYTLAYNVSDSGGNDADEVTREVTVVDTLDPIISLVGDDPLTLDCFEAFADPGATAVDQCEGDVSVTVDATQVDTGLPGEYTVFYSASDGAGNTANATRTVIVNGAGSTTLFVAPDGDDTTGDGTVGNPFATIGYTMDQAACIAAEDNPVTIRLAAGDYVEAVTFADDVFLFGESPDTSLILPTQQQLVTAENVAVRGGARSAIGNVGIRLPASAPTASSIVFIDDVSMTVRRCALNGLNVPLSIGIRVSGVDSSDTEITDSVIERVNQGAVINESNANFAFNVLRLIDDDAVSVAPASSKGENGTTPVFGDVNQPQQTGSNTFEDIGGAFIDNDNNEEMLAQYNDFDGLTETNEIDQSIDGNVNFSPFLKSTNFFASTVVVTVRDSQTGDLLEGAEATSVPSVGDGIEASPGIYTYTLTSGRYSFVFRKDGFQRTNVVEDVENPIENFDVLVDPEDPPAEAIHTGDQNSDSIINLGELLRIVQFYNANTHSCEQGTEDGYTPGASGSQDCGLHAADYQGPFWQITLAELLRVIQIFNSGGYTYCPGDGEDTYCPATK